MTADSQIRVLAYADSGIFSGAESLFCDLVTPLARDGRFLLSAAAPRENRELTDRLGRAIGEPPGFDVPAQRLPLAAFDLYNPRRRRAVGAAVRTSGADVVLLNLPSAEYGATPLLVRRSGIPVVGIMHISGTMGDLGFRLGRVREMLARRAVSRLDSVLLLSEEARNRYRDQWRPRETELSTFHTVAPEIRLPERDLARAGFGLPANRTLIGIIGRLTVKQKGHDTLVEAAAGIARRCEDAGFVVVGDGRDRSRIEQAVARAGLTDRFFFLGQVTDIPAALAAIDLIAMPSRFEGLPLAALEALSAGVPGVASSVDGLCDVWPAEWRVEPDAPDQLAAKLLRLLDGGEPVQREMVARGRELMSARVGDGAADVAASLQRAVSRA